MDLQLRMASLLSLHKKYDDALSLLRSVNADKPEIQERIVQILLIAGRFDDAQSALKDRSFPESAQMPSVCSRLGHWRFMSMACIPEAVDRATQALAITPNDPTSLFCRARADFGCARPMPMRRCTDLQLVRQASPNNIEVRLTLSDAYIMLNRSEDAIAELEAGVRALPNNKELRMKLVNLYVNGLIPG